MPDTRNTLFVMAAGAGFFLAMYQWVTMMAETMPESSRSAILDVRVPVSGHRVEQLRRRRSSSSYDVLHLVG